MSNFLLPKVDSFHALMTAANVHSLQCAEMPYDPPPQIRLAFEGRSPSHDEESLAIGIPSHYLLCFSRSTGTPLKSIQFYA